MLFITRKLSLSLDYTTARWKLKILVDLGGILAWD